MADILTKLSSKYKCDKSDKNHVYTPLYHKLFEKYRNKKFNFIEFGFGIGSSAKMWMEYFTRAKLITIDILPEPTDNKILNYIKQGRLEYIQINQIDRKYIERNVLEKYKEFLFIIDDASHVAEDQQFTFNFCFPYVIKKGWYIIEDLKCKRNPNKSFPILADKTLELLFNYKKTNKFESKILSKSENELLTKNIRDISTIDKISFIRKK